MILSFEVQDAMKKTLYHSQGEDEVNLVCNREYKVGDCILFKSSEKNVHIWLQFDDAKGRSLVYIKDYITMYPIPFGEERNNISPKAFHGDLHLLSAKAAKDYEIKAYRNLCLNVNDQNSSNITCYPHASANVETRGEVVFAARNVIDGVNVNNSHGGWPYQSWGINQREDALLKIDFGRKVHVDRIVLYTRADFPHDNWWEKATFSFSDGSQMEVKMNKSSLPHEFTFEWKEIEWLELSHLIKSPEDSPFPALSQIEVYGKEVI
jgi:hypothetical protein